MKTVQELTQELQIIETAFAETRQVAAGRATASYRVQSIQTKVILGQAEQHALIAAQAEVDKTIEADPHPDAGAVSGRPEAAHGGCTASRPEELHRRSEDGVRRRLGTVRRPLQGRPCPVPRTPADRRSISLVGQCGLPPYVGAVGAKPVATKPMSPAQEQAALELGSEFAAVSRLASSFKDEYSGDLRSTLQRQFGKVAGGAAPEATQEMTRWWSDQAMMDELPKRHELFGAALTATEQKSWQAAAINPSLSPEVIKKRLAARQEIMQITAERMKGNPSLPDAEDV